MNDMRLLTPGRIGRIETKNRIVMAPMVRNYAEPTGLVNSRYRAHWSRIARGGVGTMILEASFVSPEGRGFSHQVGIHSDDTVEGLRDLTQIARQHKAVSGVQLYHAGRQTTSQVTGEPPVAPSAIKDPVMQETPDALEAEDIRRIITAFARAAERARSAEFDFVEIHGAHGYLINQFLSPFTNTRDDDYGGNFDNRFRFLQEIVEAVRSSVEHDFPVTVRLSGDEMVENGLTIEDTLEIARRLENLGVDGLHISACNYASAAKGYMIQPMAIEDGPLISMADRVKEEVQIPIIAVGKIRFPELAEETLISGKADFIALGRSFLADPDWPKKLLEGRKEETNFCIACNQGCISRLMEQKDVWCTINPETAREELFGHLETPEKKKVLIAGGGPGGMQAAITAAEMGHQVILCEKQNQLGGQLIAAAAAPYRPGWSELRQYLVGELHRLKIEVRLESEVDADLVKKETTDMVVIAIGASPLRPSIEGIANQNVVTARDILEGRTSVSGKVVVAGGGCAGAQTAEFLAAKGLPVTIIEMTDNIAIDAPQEEQYLLVNRLEESGVDFRTRTKIIEIQEKTLLIENDSGQEEITAETVVLCLGSEPNNGLAEAIQETVPRLAVIGDAVEARKVTEAMMEGALCMFSL